MVHHGGQGAQRRRFTAEDPSAQGANLQPGILGLLDFRFLQTALRTGKQADGAEGTGAQPLVKGCCVFILIENQGLICLGCPFQRGSIAGQHQRRMAADLAQLRDRRQHLDAVLARKQGIHLRAYGQHDPVVEYKNEGYEMFQAMIQGIRDETVRRMFLVQLRPTQEVKRERVAKETGTGAAVNAVVKKQPVRNAAKKVGPNDPCPCGSGQKYKKCCMQKDKTTDM